MFIHRLNSLYSLIYFALKGGVAHAKFKGVTVGRNCRIYIFSWGSEPFLISLGNNVTITSGVKILTHDGSTCLISDEEGRRFQKYSPVTIGNNVFIGVGSIIMPGVVIGNNVIVAAGSVVTKSIESGIVVGGNPARRITSFDEYETKVKKSYVSNTEIQHIANYEERVQLAIEIQNEKK